MPFSNRSIKIGLATLILGMLLSLASAWCEVEAHLKNAQPVQQVGTPGGSSVYHETPSFYLASSMAIRLFSVGALFIVVGALQIQRAQLNERVALLEKQLATFRNC
jgi:hypothetical protein